jgi:tRNA (cmo5U34)-methyltransferase
MKSTPEQIQQRFDQEVERFSNLETGQAATIDAPLAMELITRAAAAVTPGATSSLDVGCGAGNYTLKLLGRLPNLDVTLIDLSQPMLQRAVERIGKTAARQVRPIQGDVRTIDLGEGQFDIIVAAAVLHHLRGDEEWLSVFQKFHRALRPGGSIWISDLIEHSHAAVHQMMWDRYGDFLESQKDSAYRKAVFEYIEVEDTPRPLIYQLDLLRRVGFRGIEVLHKNSVFAAFGGVK